MKELKKVTNTDEIIKEKQKLYKELKKMNNADKIKKEKLYTTERPYYIDFFILFFLVAFFSPLLFIYYSNLSMSVISFLFTSVGRTTNVF